MENYSKPDKIHGKETKLYLSHNTPGAWQNYEEDVVPLTTGMEFVQSFLSDSQ